MPRGLWSQSIAILTRTPIALEALETRLAAREPKRRSAGDTEDAPAWIGSPQSLLVPYRPEVNGWIEVDVFDAPWPDEMGDPSSDPLLFGAWTLGAFGPGAFPGGLARAVQQCVRQPEAVRTAVAEHGAFVRARTSYVYGAGDEAKVLPADHDPVDELSQLASLAVDVASEEDALAYFNPSGEVVLDPASLGEALNHAARAVLPALDAFSHVRLFQIGEAPGWAVMDTVGMGQFGLPDSEACVPPGQDPNAVATWLRNVCLYLLQAGPVIEAEHTVDGPGGDWRVIAAPDESLLAPPRGTLRWAPEGAPVPDVLKG